MTYGTPPPGFNPVPDTSNYSQVFNLAMGDPGTAKSIFDALGMGPKGPTQPAVPPGGPPPLAPQQPGQLPTLPMGLPPQQPQAQGPQQLPGWQKNWTP